jgi:hypothetical protein
VTGQYPAFPALTLPCHFVTKAFTGEGTYRKKRGAFVKKVRTLVALAALAAVASVSWAAPMLSITW